MSSTTGQPRNRRYIRVSQRRKTNLRWPENSIEHQNVHRRRSISSSASIYIRVYTSEADFHKPEIYGGRMRVPGMGYRVGRASLHAASRWSRSPGCCGYISWCVFLVSGGISFFLFVIFFPSNAHGLLQARGNLASCTSLPVTRQGRGSEATEAVFCL